MMILTQQFEHPDDFIWNNLNKCKRFLNGEIEGGVDNVVLISELIGHATVMYVILSKKDTWIDYEGEDRFQEFVMEVEKLKDLLSQRYDPHGEYPESVQETIRLVNKLTDIAWAGVIKDNDVQHNDDQYIPLQKLII
jgi:hypothetical protein